MYGDGLSVRIAQSSLNFRYEELRKATNYFDPSNKLGQGSYGAVYKVRYKRFTLSEMLVCISKQWVKYETETFRY